MISQQVLQDCTSISTTEAEYVAMSEACKEAIWLARLVGELGLRQMMLVLHCDSQSAITLAKNLLFHERRKHIDVLYHFICKCFASNKLDLVKIHTLENIIDALTKNLSCHQF